MTDRELLELAARAAGYCYNPTIKMDGDTLFGCYGDSNDQHITPWNPLKDCGDAFILAVKLGLWVHCGKYHVAIECTTIEEDCGRDPYAATRRAIVRAAAEIGRQMTIKEK